MKKITLRFDLLHGLVFSIALLLVFIWYTGTLGVLGGTIIVQTKMGQRELIVPGWLTGRRKG